MPKVYLTGKPVEADLTPSFIIQVGTVYYWTKAVWTYDPAQVTNEDQGAGVAQIAEDFANLAGPDADYVARQVGDGSGDDNPPSQTS